jgi:hypothetical protein
MATTLMLVLLVMQAAHRDKPPESLATLSVCEVIANDPTKLNGSVTKIRGLLATTDEGIWLIDECKTHLATKGLTWGNTLWVYVDPSDEEVLRSWGKMGAKITELHADTQRDRIWVTVIGRLVTRGSMDDEVVQRPYGLAKVGFGHLGGSPAEINIISVEDVTVERQSKDAKQKTGANGN